MPEIAARLGVHRVTVARMIRAGRFPRPPKPNGDVKQRIALWPAAEIDAWIEEKIAGRKA
jgi:predicted DNA-binding transcriptional regulator AlpA